MSQAVKRSSKALLTGRVLALSVVGLLIVVPLLLLLSGSLMSAQELYRGETILPAESTFENYRYVWVEGRFHRYFFNSMLYTVIIVPASVLLASMASFAFARLKFRGSGLLFGSFLAVLMFPLAVMFVPVFTTLLQLGLVDTRTGYMLPILAGALPLNTFIMHRFFKAIPREIEEAAIIDGVSSWGLFSRIGLPLAKPGLAACAVLTLVTVWNEFLLAVVVFRTGELMPVQQGLMQFAAAERPEQQLMLAASAIAIIPVVLVYIFAQRAITRGVMEGAVKG